MPSAFRAVGENRVDNVNPVKNSYFFFGIYMTSPIIAVLGTPKSGISILGQCLRMLGLTSMDDQAHVDISTIHGLLFQDLDHSTTMAGPLPQGWMQAPGVKRSRKRINALLTNCRNETSSLFLADPFLCRFMPLWTEAFQEAGLAHRFVLMVRHPWEAAPSLARVENIDLAKAHLLWLAHVRDALLACQDQDYVMVTFDQLLADPVSTLTRMGTELDLTWPNDPWSVSSSLLDFVQPNLKRHHVSNQPGKDKHAFQAYERLYQEIRRGQWTGMADGNAVELSQLQNPYSILPAAKGIMPVQPPTDTGHDLIDSLLDVVGQYEKQMANRQTEQERIAVEAGPPLFAQVVFPSDREGGEVVETIPLLTEEWQHIAVPVPESTLLKDKPIIFKPLNTNGTVKISAISLINRATGNSVWSAKTSNEFDQIVVQGSAVRLPDQDNLTLLITGNEPGLYLPLVGNVIDVPFNFILWIKASMAQSTIRSYLPKHFLADRQYTIGTIHHLSCSGGSVMSKCLASMQDVVLLSEIHPCSSGGIRWNPFDPLQHFQASYPEYCYTHREDLKKIFWERISWVSEKCRKNNLFLILRDHSHWDFLLNGCVDSPPLLSFLSELFITKPMVTLRNPIDSYLSLKANPIFPTDVKTFDTYCQRITIFLEKYHFAKVFLYEDFVKNPDSVLKQMCDVYGIEYNPAWRDNFYKIKLTGDSGRGKQFKDIKKLERRAYDDAFKKEVLESNYFMKLSEQYMFKESIL